MELTDKQKRKLLSAAEVVDKGDMAVLEKILELQDFVESKESQIDESVESAKEEIENLKKIVDKKIAEVKDGNDYVLTPKDKKDIASQIIVPVVEKVIERTETIKEQPVVKEVVTEKTTEVQVLDEKKLEESLPKYGSAVRDGLELLPEDEKLTIASIKDLRRELDELKNRKPQINGGIIGRDLIKDIDISSQLDGIKTTFNIQSIWNVITVDLSSFPYGSLRKNVDYTWTPTSVTFTSQIDPSTQLASGQSCVLTVVTS